MAVPIPPPKEFPKPENPESTEYFEGVEVNVPPRKVYKLQLSTTFDGNGSIPKGWYICKEGRPGVAISGVDFKGEYPINVEEDFSTSQGVVETQIRINEVDNVGD